MHVLAYPSSRSYTPLGQTRRSLKLGCIIGKTLRIYVFLYGNALEQFKKASCLVDARRKGVETTKRIIINRNLK